MALEIWARLLDSGDALVASRDEELNTFGEFIVGNPDKLTDPKVWEGWYRLMSSQHEQWAELGIYLDRPYEGAR